MINNLLSTGRPPKELITGSVGKNIIFSRSRGKDARILVYDEKGQVCYEVVLDENDIHSIARLRFDDEKDPTPESP